MNIGNNLIEKNMKISLLKAEQMNFNNLYVCIYYIIYHDLNRHLQDYVLYIIYFKNMCKYY